MYHKINRSDNQRPVQHTHYSDCNSRPYPGFHSIIIKETEPFALTSDTDSLYLNGQELHMPNRGYRVEFRFGADNERRLRMGCNRFEILGSHSGFEAFNVYVVPRDTGPVLPAETLDFHLGNSPIHLGGLPTLESLAFFFDATRVGVTQTLPVLDLSGTRTTTISIREIRPDSPFMSLFGANVYLEGSWHVLSETPSAGARAPEVTPMLGIRVNF